jgi:hypothetical protein
VIEMRTVRIHVYTHKCHPNCEHRDIDYEIELREEYAEITLITYGIAINPYKWKILRQYLLRFLLSLNSKRRDWEGIGNMRIQDFLILSFYIFLDVI